MTVLASFPAHGIILARASTWFDTRTGPSDLGGDRLKVLRMEVECPGQLAAAEAVVESAYLHSLPDVVLGDQALLVQVLVVADSYGFGRVLSRAAGALAALVPAEASAAVAASATGAPAAPAAAAPACSSMAWDTADAVLGLPDALRLQAAVQPAVAAALRRVSVAFCDLEVAWQDPALRQVWVGLPAAAVEHVLGHADTKVACENTALYALACWVGSQQAQRRQPITASELDGLCRHVRLQHLSLAYAAVVAPKLPWFWGYLTRSGRLQAWLYIKGALACSIAFKRNTAAAALTAPPRPRSSLQHVNIKVDVPAAAMEKALVDKSKWKGVLVGVPPHGAFFSGYFWTVKVDAWVTGALGGVRTLGLFLRHRLEPPAGWASVAVVTPEVGAKAADALGMEGAGDAVVAGTAVSAGTVTTKFSSLNKSNGFCKGGGWHNFFGMKQGNLDAWKAQVVQAADGGKVLPVTATVKGVVCAPP